MKTLIIGASTNPERYAYKAAISLTNKGHEIVLLGLREGEIEGNRIHTDKPFISDIDTVTLYVGVQNQAAWYDYILVLKPRRVVFNPNTENPDFAQQLEQNGIETIEACTLVMLSLGTY